MKRSSLLLRLLLGGSLMLGAAGARAVTVRVACYNIEADVNGDTAPNAGLDTVLEAIGEQNVNGVVQPLDVLALEETTSNSATVAPIVADLNTYYGAGTYAASPFQATEVGNSPGTGNGPNALIYNATTLTLLESVGVGTPQGSTNGEYRQIARYELQPVDGTVANAFYVYVSHMKSSFSGTTTAVQTARNEEAQIIRADSAALPAGACVLYMGDFNLDGSTEPAYQTLTAAGAAQGVDPLNNNPQDDTEVWDSATYQGILTESSTSLDYRDDLQFVGANVFAGSVTGGLQFLSGSYRAFGNNGTTAYGKSVNSSANTALDNLQGPITAAQARSALTTASDHLPVVADYSISLTAIVTPPTPTPVPTPTPTPTPVPTPTPTPGSVAPVVTSATVVTAQTGTSFIYAITAANSPATYGAAGLPGGITIDASTGLIAGFPNEAGTFSVTLSATNAAGTGTALLTLTITPALPFVNLVATVPVAYASGSVPGFFTITRDGDLSVPLTVNYTIKGSAQSGVDYRAIPASKTVKAGRASKRIRILPVDESYYAGGKRTVKIIVNPSDTYNVVAGRPVRVKIEYTR